MKNILVKLIEIYQKMPLSCHNNCRYTPTCSEYAKIAITEYGSIKGGFLAIKRILSCNPFGSYGYSPVPKKGVKNEKNI